MSSIVDCLRRLGYERLTELQKKAFKSIASEGKHVLIVAPTGSGKTEAAILPVFYRVRAGRVKPFAAIYVTPLRALNRDIERRIKSIASCFELSVAVRHGDTPGKARRNLYVNPPHVLITTPESFTYVLVNEKLWPYMSNVKYLIIDEFHEMIRSKRGLALLTILYLLREYYGFKPTVIALSATLSNPMEVSKLIPVDDIEILVDDSAKAVELKVAVPRGGSKGILGDERLESRLQYITRTVEAYGSIIVFTNTRSLAESLGSTLKAFVEKLGLDFEVAVHHGSLSRAHRERVEEGFKEGRIKLLVATSSMELGIDVGRVNYVIQYLSPRQSSRLIQRVGRSGHRLGGVSRGTVVSTGNTLHLLESLVLAREALKGRVEREDITPKPLDVLAYATAVLTVLNRSGVSKEDLFERLKKYTLYSSLNRDEYDRLVEYLKYTRVVREDSGILKQTRRTRLYIYETTMIPSTRDLVVVEASTGRRIGSLNEEYVVLNLKPDDIVVLAGESWRIIGVDEDEGRVYVERAAVDYSEAVIPHWEGESIPVEASTARMVGEVVDYIRENGRLPEDLEKLLETPVEIPLDAVRELSGAFEIYVDYVEDFNMVFININWGSKVNSFIRDLLILVLKQKYPLAGFEAYSSPYAIILRIKGYTPPLEILKVIEDTLRRIGEYTADPGMLKRVAREGQLFYWRVYQTAQRFSAVKPGETRVTKAMLEALGETVIGDEALKEVLVRDYDLESTLKLASMISTGEVSIKRRLYKQISKHHVEILGYIELPVKREIAALDRSQYLERLLERELTLVCLNCGYVKQGKVRELMEMNSYSCPRCHRATLTVVKGEGEEERILVDKLKRGEKLKAHEQRLREDLARRAIILFKFGRQALLAFAGRGVGTDEAVRILNNVSRGMDIVSEVYEREKEFLRVKKYIEKSSRV
ncbi:MAG: DEAD/DEAH box helicase [Desulfurococcus sp.]|nr:DEAD/DEAH box helicase [Desulfurococcus sp.]